METLFALQGPPGWVCHKCRLWKPLVEYHKRTKSPNGLSPKCKACCLIADKAARARYREKNEGKNVRAEAVKYGGRKKCASCGEVKSLHLFSLNNVSRTGISSNCLRCVMYYNAMRRAKKEGIPFDIEPLDIYIPDTCPVLGLPLRHGVGQNDNNSPSIDRKIPHLGYIKGNILVISWLANKVKSDCTDPTVLEQVADYIRKNSG